MPNVQRQSGAVMLVAHAKMTAKLRLFWSRYKDHLITIEKGVPVGGATPGQGVALGVAHGLRRRVLVTCCKRARMRVQGWWGALG